MTHAYPKHIKAQGLSKLERLCHKREIQSLFTQGLVLKFFPIKVVIQREVLNEPDTLPLHQVIFSAPKKNFKKAHQRNTIKRLMREAYRLNKSVLYVPAETAVQWKIGFIFVSPKFEDIAKIPAKLKAALNQIVSNEMDTNSPAKGV